MSYLVDDRILRRVSELLDWYRGAQVDPDSLVLPHPVKDRWKEWDDNRLWCSFFFSIVVPGGSRVARDYLEPIEDGLVEFELRPSRLLPLTTNQRQEAIWKFGRGENRLGKALGRFFSKPGNVGDTRNCEHKLTHIFGILEERGFKRWFEEIDSFDDDRLKAAQLEFLPGAKLKVSRDFLNDLGMTDTVIPLDVHVLAEMNNRWGWHVPKDTPTDRALYEAIEDSVRKIAIELDCTVVEIDKSIYFSRSTKEY